MDVHVRKIGLGGHCRARLFRFELSRPVVIVGQLAIAQGTVAVTLDTVRDFAVEDLASTSDRLLQVAFGVRSRNWRRLGLGIDPLLRDGGGDARRGVARLGSGISC